MKTLEEKTLGYYKPGFLHLNIKTNQIVELNSILAGDKRLFSTFIHEYIHFLQNITTTTGLYESTDYIQHLKDMVTNIKIGNETFEIPLKSNSKFNRIGQNILRNIYRGSVGIKVKYARYNSYKVDFVEIVSSDGTKINAPIYKVEYYDLTKKKTGLYDLGAVAIKEYITHTIQNHFYPASHPQIPYHIVDLIISKEVPALKNMFEQKIMLCEASLMSLHPARTFFNTLDKLKMSDNIPDSGLKMYHYAHQDVRYQGELGDFDYMELFRYFHNKAIYDYADALGSPIFQKELSWVKYVFENGMRLRLRKPDFILDLLRTPEVVIKNISKILDELGTPFMTNSLGQGSFILPQGINDRPEQIYILTAVAEFMFVLSGQKGCNMYKFCNSEERTKPMTNEKCLSRPWEKMDEEELCPFCQLWKTWEVYKKQPVTQIKPEKRN